MKEILVNEVVIHVDDNKNVYISGHNKLVVESSGDVDIRGKKVTISSEEETLVLSDKHLVQKAPRIDLNPNEDDDGYIEYRKEKGLY